MMSRTVRAFALTSFLAAGLIGWSGCSEETKEKVKEAEHAVVNDVKKDVKAAGEEIKKDTKIAGEKIKEGVKEAGDKIKEVTSPAPTAPTTPVETPK